MTTSSPPAVPTGALRSRLHADLQRLQQSVTDPTVAARLAEIGRALSDPLRIAVAGRVKAGKSTLVNALLRQRVAPTDVGECTKIVTWYRYGVPERFEIVLRSGERQTRPLQPDGSLPATVGVDPADVERLEVFLSIQDLSALTIIDTPGLSSANDEFSASTRELLALDRVSRAAIGHADVLLLVMAMEPHGADVDALGRFDEQFSGLPCHALNSVGVLSRIDQIDLGTDELASHVGSLAERFSDHHHLSLASVLPVNGLLAETTRCGVLTEPDVAALRTLAALPADDQAVLLLSARRFVSASCPVSTNQRDRLLRILDLRGVSQALQFVAQGVTSAPALARALDRQSGMAALAGEVFGRFGAWVEIFKASWVVSALVQLSTASPVDRPRIAVAIEDLTLANELLQVSLMRSVQRHAAGEVTLPEDRVESLLRLAGEASPTARLGVGDGTNGGDASRAAFEGIRRWRSFANDGRAGPAEREVADVACRAIAVVLDAVESSSDAGPIGSAGASVQKGAL